MEQVFVVNSNDWDFTGENVSSVSDKLETILTLLDECKDRGENVYYGNDLQSKHVINNLTLWDFLYSDAMSSINKDIKDELIAHINTATFYEEKADIWPREFLETNVKNGSNIECSLEMSFVHHHLMDGNISALLSFSHSAPLHSNSSRGNIYITTISSSQSHKDFWRTTALHILRDTAENLQKISPNAYPELFFHDKSWGNIDVFDGGYAAVGTELKKYLSILDDHGAWIFNTPPPALHKTDAVAPIDTSRPTNQLIEERFRGVGLTMSPEKPNVRTNENCKLAREITVKNKTLYCEWHGKLELHKNRIHIYPPVPESGQKLVIGIFHSHLPLPS
ncbi:hypothetical protein ACEUAN_17210 [Aeromonas veronii]